MEKIKVKSPVVELDGQGKIVARHELEIPQDAVINFLRTAQDAAGHRYYAGSASGQQQLFLFDSNWKLLTAFPDLSLGKHAGIGDVQFIDFDGQGDVKLAVGYWGLVGVQIVSLEGKRLASDRSMQFVLRMAASPRDEEIPSLQVSVPGQATTSTIVPAPGCASSAAFNSS